MTAADTTGFMCAVADCKPLGWSLYAFSVMRHGMWAALRGPAGDPTGSASRAARQTRLDHGEIDANVPDGRLEAGGPEPRELILDGVGEVHLPVDEDRAGLARFPGTTTSPSTKRPPGTQHAGRGRAEQARFAGSRRGDGRRAPRRRDRTGPSGKLVLEPLQPQVLPRAAARARGRASSRRVDPDPSRALMLRPERAAVSPVPTPSSSTRCASTPAVAATTASCSSSYPGISASNSERYVSGFHSQSVTTGAAGYSRSAAPALVA